MDTPWTGTTTRLQLDIPAPLIPPPHASASMSNSNTATVTADAMHDSDSFEGTHAPQPDQRIPVIVLSPRLSPTPEPPLDTEYPLSAPIPPVRASFETRDSEEASAEILFVSSLRAGATSQRNRRRHHSSGAGNAGPLLDDSDRALRNAWDRETFDEFLEDELDRQAAMNAGSHAGLAVEDEVAVQARPRTADQPASDDAPFLPAWYARTLEALVDPIAVTEEGDQAEPRHSGSTPRTIPPSTIFTSALDRPPPMARVMTPLQSIWRSDLIDVPRSNAIVPRGGVSRGPVTAPETSAVDDPAAPLSDVRSFMQSPPPSTSITPPFLFPPRDPDTAPPRRGVGVRPPEPSRIVRVPSGWTDTRRRSPEDTRTLMGRGFRRNQDVVLLYCGTVPSSPEDQLLPQGWHWAETPKSTRRIVGCGVLLCARGLTLATKTKDADGDIQQTWATDLPPLSSRVGDVVTTTDPFSKTRPARCLSCTCREMACRTCGNFIGYRVLERCTACCKAFRTSAAYDLLFNFTGAVTPITRQYGYLPPTYLTHRNVSQPKTPNDRLDDWGRIAESSPLPGQTLKWRHMPDAQADFEAGLVGEVKEWLDLDEEPKDAWWVVMGVARHVRDVARPREYCDNVDLGNLHDAGRQQSITRTLNDNDHLQDEERRVRARYIEPEAATAQPEPAQVMSREDELRTYALITAGIAAFTRDNAPLSLYGSDYVDTSRVNGVGSEGNSSAARGLRRRYSVVGPQHRYGAVSAGR